MGTEEKQTIWELPDGDIPVEALYDKATSIFEGRSGTRSNGSLASHYSRLFEDAEGEQSVQMTLKNFQY